MCARSYFNLVGLAAKGDAGSPLVLQKENENIVIGIASVKSWFLQFGPSIFTRVSSYSKWIDESMKNGGKRSTSTTKAPGVTTVATSTTVTAATSAKTPPEQTEATTTAKVDTTLPPQTSASESQVSEGETTSPPPEVPTAK